MSVLSCGNTIEVFKFRETGLVALCQEVAAYANDPNDRFLEDADLDTAEYAQDSGGNHIIRFRRK